MTDAEQTSGITLLVNWANSRDHWVRPLVAAVLDARGVTPVYAAPFNGGSTDQERQLPFVAHLCQVDGMITWGHIEHCPRWVNHNQWR